MAPADIGPYRVQRLLKRGGAGSVYIAHDRRLDRRVALKLVAVPEFGPGRDRVAVEARRLAALSHRFIVQVFDIVELRSHIAIVMEYVPGTDLEELALRLPLDLGTVLQLSVDLCAALAAAHRVGLVHRDLKPSNVLIDPEGQVKLADFGIAGRSGERAAGSGALPGQVPGSYTALSPEHARGDCVDQRSDLFALGLLVYRLLAGRHPFVDTPGEPQALQRLQQQPHLPLGEVVEAVPPRLDALVDTLLQKDPRLRPASALHVRQELLAILRELPHSRARRLDERLAAIRREEGEAVSASDLPEGIDSVTSALRPPGEGNVGDSMVNRRRGWVLPVLACAALAVVPLGIRWLQQDALAIRLHSSQVSTGADAAATPGADRLAAMLDDAVAASGNFYSDAGAVAQLWLRVSCNPYLCDAQLTLRGVEPMASDYRIYMPGAPESVWRAGLGDALGRLAERPGPRATD